MALYQHQFDPVLDRELYNGRSRVLLLATTGRCGSHLLGHVLTADGRFGVPMEYLNPSNMAEWRKRIQITGQQPVLPPIMARRTAANGIFSLKAHWTQFKPYWNAQRGDGANAEPDWVLLLYRRDLLSQAVSFDIASQTGQWISGMPARGKAVYNPDGIRRRAAQVRAQNQEWRNWLAQRPALPRMVIAYEDFLADPAAVLAGIRTLLLPGDDQPIVPRLSTDRQSGADNARFRDQFRREAQPDDDWIFTPQNLEN